MDVSRAWVCRCVVSDLNAIVTKALPRVNANVTVIHSALAAPGWMANLVTMAMKVIGVPPLFRAIQKQNVDKTLHGSSLRHSHFIYYIACFCLKSPSSNNLQPCCLASLCTTGLLTMVILPFSCTSVCHPPKGPNCGSRPHCHLPVWNQRKPSACCLLAEGGKSGKSKQSHTTQCVDLKKYVLLLFSIICSMLKYSAILADFVIYCVSNVINTQHFVWIHLAVYNCWVHMILLPCIYTQYTQHFKLYYLSSVSLLQTQIHLCSQEPPKRQCAWQSANRFPVTLHW